MGGISEAQPDLPIALRACKVGFPDSCDVPKIIQSPESSDNSAWTIYFMTGNDDCKKYALGSQEIPEVKVGDVIKLVGSGQVDSCLAALKDRYCQVTTGTTKCTPPTGTWPDLTVPIIDCDGNLSSGTVLGFATIDLNEVQSAPQKKVVSTLQCNVVASGPPGGLFAGTYSNQPVLVK